MSSFYNRMRSAGLKMLIKRGLPITLTRKTQGTYDPNTGTTSSATLANYACTGCIVSIDSEAANQFYSTGTLRESSIRKEDKMIILSALKTDKTLLEIVPDPITDSLTFNSVNYDVVAIVPLETDGTPVLYSVQVRK